jgi:hypothetical protein
VHLAHLTANAAEIVAVVGYVERGSPLPHAIDHMEKYEDRFVAMPHVSEAAMLRSLMDEKGVRQVVSSRDGLTGREVPGVLRTRHRMSQAETAGNT